MSDYEEFEGAESELGKYESVLEVSGYDAVTTKQAGLRQDEYMKDSGLSIDTFGEAEKAQQNEEKEKKRTADIRDDFFRAQADLNKQEYAFKMDGENFNISHGDLKDILQDTMVDLKDKMINGKTPEERAQAALDYQRILDIKDKMDKGGHPTEDDMKFMIDDFAKRDDDFKDRIKNDSKPLREKVLDADVEDRIVSRRAAQNEGVGAELVDSFNTQSEFILAANDIESELSEVMISQSNHNTPAGVDGEQISNAPENFIPNAIKANDFDFG